MTQTALTRDQVLAMEPMEVGLAVAEHIFKAKVIGKEGCPESRLLIGHFGYNSWQPLSGERWQNASWRNSDERAWLDCPRYGESISAAWEVEEKIKELRLQAKYCEALKQVVIGTGEYVGMFDYIHATPEQRCKAALLAVLDL